MLRGKFVCFILVALFLSGSVNAENSHNNENNKSEPEEHNSEYEDVVLKEYLLIFNFQVSSINGSFADDIQKYDNSPFAQLIFSGILSYDKLFNYKYSLGANIGYSKNKIDYVRSHAFSYSGNFSYYIKGYKNSSSYFKTELGFIKASSDDKLFFTSSKKTSTGYIPFFRLGFGIHGHLGNSGVLRFEIFYKHILSDNKKISGINNYKIEGNLSTIGLAIGFGLSW